MAEEPEKLDISDEMIAERRGGLGKMPDDMPFWMAKSIINIDKFSKGIGNIVCWILMPLIFAMTYEVLARKLFLAPTIWAYDISRFLYGALFMLGAGYALSRGVHIRNDLCRKPKLLVLKIIFLQELHKSLQKLMASISSKLYYQSIY